MNKLDVIKFLIAEIEEEQKLAIEYEKAESEARQKEEAKIKAGEPHSYYWHYMKWDKPIPKKANISHNLRKIRQLALGMLKEK